MRHLNIDNFTLNKMRSNRESLVKTLEQKNIKDKNVLDAIRYLPRELFVIQTFYERAYEDTALPIDEGQTISQPYTVAYMTELLNIREGDKILEIGTGSGYQAALLYLLGADVYSVERISELYKNVKNIFKQLGVNIHLRLGDGSLGWSEYAPYDSIIVTAAAPEIPNKIVAQLKIGGRLVIPIGNKISQDMFLIERVDDEHFTEKKLDKFKFVPLIGRQAWDK